MSAGTLNEETLAMAAGALLSLAFSYVPGLGDRYGALTPAAKRLVMLANQATYLISPTPPSARTLRRYS
jgi:hypothetical protein